eukprot:8338110-Pyramimonas_sp.AAC.1
MLHVAIEPWHNNLSSYQLNQLRVSLSKLSDKCIWIGTGFSVCDMAWYVLQALSLHWRTLFCRVPEFTLAFT